MNYCHSFSKLEILNMSYSFDLAGLEGEELSTELKNGARFVVYQYAISMILFTIKNSSHIQFIHCNDSVIKKGLKYSLLSFLFGWWGVPFGPIYTLSTIIHNFFGGTDVTQDVIAIMIQDGEITPEEIALISKSDNTEILDA